ncbi:MAG: YcgL domain-containing protein, partial [Glaciecola sp.]|nr:YcgL domain-containing protein [Glaciecola sp.]
MPKKEDFSAVPEGLLARFGHPELVMLMALPTDKTFVNLD